MGQYKAGPFFRGSGIIMCWRLSMDKRKYVKDFYYRYRPGNTDDESFWKMNDMVGKGWPLFNFVKEIYGDAEDPTPLDDVHLEVLMLPGKLEFYPEKTIDLLYKTIKLIELNNKVKVIVPLSKVVKTVYLTIHNAYATIYNKFLSNFLW
jgi:hypothetical protein